MDDQCHYTLETNKELREELLKELKDFRQNSLTPLETDSESIEGLDQRPQEKETNSSSTRLKWDYKYDFEAKREVSDIPQKTSCLDPLQEPVLPEHELMVSVEIDTDDDSIDVRSLDSYTQTSEDYDESFGDGSISSEERDGFIRYKRGFTEELPPPLPQTAPPLLRSQNLLSQEYILTDSPPPLPKSAAPQIQFQSYLIKRQQSVSASSPPPPPLPKSSPPPLPVRSSQSPTSSYTSCEIDVDDRIADVESEGFENESEGDYGGLTEEEGSDEETENNEDTVEEYDEGESTEMEESNDEEDKEDEMYMYEENAETDESDTPRINIESEDNTSDEEHREGNISNISGVFCPNTKSKYKTLEDLSSIGFHSSSDGEERTIVPMSSYSSDEKTYFARALMAMKAVEADPAKQKEMSSKPLMCSKQMPLMSHTSNIERFKLVIADEEKEQEAPTTPMGTPLLTPPPMFRSESPDRETEDLTDEVELKTTSEEDTSSNEVIDDDDDYNDDDDDDDDDDEMRHIIHSMSSYNISTARQSWNPPYPRTLEPIPESPLVTPSPTPSSISCISSISDSDNPLQMFGMSPVPKLDLSSVQKDSDSCSSSSTEVASESSCLESDEDTLSLHSDSDAGEISDSTNNQITASEFITTNDNFTRTSMGLQEDNIKADLHDDTDNVKRHRGESSYNSSVQTEEKEKENSVKRQENSQSCNTSDLPPSPKVKKIQIFHLARKDSIRDLIPPGTVEELSKVFTITDKDGKTQKQVRVLRKLRTREIKSLETSEHKFQTFLTNPNYVNISGGEESSDSSDFENFFMASDNDIDFLEKDKDRMSPVFSASSVTTDMNRVDYRTDIVSVTKKHSSEDRQSSTLYNSNKYFEKKIDASKTVSGAKAPQYTCSTNCPQEQVKQNDTVNPRQSCLQQFVHSGARKYKHLSLEVEAVQGDSFVAQVDKVIKSKSQQVRRSAVKTETNDVSPGLGGDIPTTITGSIHQTGSMKNSEGDNEKENDETDFERNAPITMYRGSREKTFPECIPPGQNKQQRCGRDHVTSSLNNIYLSCNPLSSTTSSCSDVSSLFSVKSESRYLPADDELSIPFSKISVTSDSDDSGIKMPEPSSSKTRVLKSSRTKTYAENVNGDKSSKTFSETYSDDQNDINGNSIDEEEIAAVLPKLAESVAKLQNGNIEELLPGLTQSVTKLKDGSGNLVITTMTRKIVEEEGEEEEIDRKSESSGRYSPVGQIIEVEDLEKGQVYLVQNSKGELFVVEDVTNTSDDTQESAYYSSSRQTSGSTSTSSSSPRLISRVSNLKQVGQSSIDYDTANELISKLYDQSGIVEIEEHDDETWERSGTYSWDRVHPQTDSHSGYPTNKKRESYTTTYEYETPSNTQSQSREPVPMAGFTSVDKVTSSYGISQTPWIADGTKSQQFQGSTSGSVDEVVNISSLPDNEAAYTMSSQKTVNASSVDQGMYTSSSSKYSFETEATILPQPTLNTATTTVYAQPVPMLYNLPPVLVPEPQPQFKLVKFDMIPTPAVEEHYTTKIDIPTTGSKHVATDRPIYKTVAVIQTPEKPKPTEVVDTKKYKILNSKATETDEVKESHMTFDEVDTKYTTQSYESLVKSTPTAEKQSFVLRKANQSLASSTPKYRSEKQMEVKKNLDQVHKTQIDIKREMAKSKAHADTETYEYSLKEKTHAKVSGDGDLGLKGILAGGYTNGTGDSDMRVIRGSYLIKNNMDEIDGEFDDNINVFHNDFTLNKENPLYQSDEDIYKRYEAEREEMERKQAEFQKSVNQDITYETVDKFTKSRQVTREPEKPKQSLSQLLLSKLSTIEAKDIRQTIDVKHHHEDIYGDPRLEHADGSSYGGTLDATKNFDTVGEKVDLMLKDGKAYITVKVTAERIVPIDLEFNVWRKNQAIVTRVTEIDLLATEQRRRIYRQVMESSDDGQTGAYYRGANETILSGKQTLDLFSQILDAADGQGDKEDITVQTKQTKTSHPVMNMDLLY